MTPLGTAGQELHDAITEEYDLRTDELVILGSACRLADRAAVLEAYLEHAPLYVPGPKDRDVPNPMLLEARSTHLALATLLGRLGLGEETDEEGGSRSASASARAMNRHRWHGKKSA